MFPEAGGGCALYTALVSRTKKSETGGGCGALGTQGSTYIERTVTGLCSLSEVARSADCAEELPLSVSAGTLNTSAVLGV